MSFIDERKALTREKRLSTLSHFDGTLQSLDDEVQGTEIKQRIRTLTQSTYDEILYALQVLSGIEETAIVVHGAVGCAASVLYQNRQRTVHWYSTNLNERDTILGGDEKLRKAVIRAYEEAHAKVIFIVGTPVVAINNDDVNSVILELEEEINARIISIPTDGFKTKAPVTGYDIVLHGLLRYVVDRSAAEAADRQDFINVVTLSENNENVAAIVKILRDLEIPFQLLPQFANVDNIKRAGQARATITLNPDEGGYFAEELEEVFGVKYIRTSVPIGLRGTRHWIRKLTAELGVEDRAEAYIEQQEERAQGILHTRLLDGHSVFLDIDLASAVHFTDFVEKLGGRVSGLAVPFIDLENRTNLNKLGSLEKSIPVVIANGQLYEKSNVLQKHKADFYISLNDQVSFAAQLGSIPISLKQAGILGYEGIAQFVRLVEQSKDRQGSYGLPDQNSLYKASWLKKSSNWYVKQEVK
ncbi:MAG: nitrogenase component 1 [Lachnospiraceae bacterium]|nr:nitrogenase component 1 [Lachnospiraceae bacterium]